MDEIKSFSVEAHGLRPFFLQDPLDNVRVNREKF